MSTENDTPPTCSLDAIQQEMAHMESLGQLERLPDGKYRATDKFPRAAEAEIDRLLDLREETQVSRPRCECIRPAITFCSRNFCNACGKTLPDEKPKLVRQWVDTGYDLPEEGEWVLHTYYGVRRPEYGLFKNGRFLRDSGPEFLPATHWLRIPTID